MRFLRAGSVRVWPSPGPAQSGSSEPGGFTDRPLRREPKHSQRTNARAAARDSEMPPKPGKKPPAAELEYCELCRHHHDLGRRHRYGRKHRAKLEAALTTFRSKLSDLRRALLHGSPSPQPPLPRLWCPFCSTELVDLDNRSAWYSLPTPRPRTPRVSVWIYKR